MRGRDLLAWRGFLVFSALWVLLIVAMLLQTIVSGPTDPRWHFVFSATLTGYGLFVVVFRREFAAHWNRMIGPQLDRYFSELTPRLVGLLGLALCIGGGVLPFW